MVGAFFTSQDSNFLTERNLLNIMRQMSFVGILAVGMTFVILTAGIDLSVGSLVAFTGVICAWVAKGSRELLSGEVQQVERGKIVIMLNKTREAEAIIPWKEQNPRERFRQGEPVK